MLGLLVASLAFSFSAFTNTKKASRINQNKRYLVFFDYLVQRSPGQFTQVNDLDPFEEPIYLACAGEAARKCIYRVTLTGKLFIPTLGYLGQTSYTSTQIDAYLANYWIATDSESDYALYWN